jgi:hypothetical protein
MLGRVRRCGSSRLRQCGLGKWLGVHLLVKCEGVSIWEQRAKQMSRESCVLFSGNHILWPLASGDLFACLVVPSLCCSLETKNRGIRKVFSLPGTVLHIDTTKGR